MLVAATARQKNERALYLLDGWLKSMSTKRDSAAGPGFELRAPSFEVPAGACDCHTHIHGDPERFPFVAGRVYTPEMTLREEMTSLHKALHIQRVVIVTPSVYGTDNSATLME